jgi:hypothetical protein
VFVHSLWCELGTNRTAASAVVQNLLGKPDAGASGFLRWTSTIPDESDDDPDGSTTPWCRRLGTSSTSQQLAMYFVSTPFGGEIAGIVSPNPLRNYRVADFLSLHAASFAFRGAPTDFASVPPWTLYALHLRSLDTSAEIIAQGSFDSWQAGLFQQIAPFNNFGIFGATLSIAETERLVTLYEDGQAWIQGVSADDIPSTLFPVVQKMAELR